MNDKKQNFIIYGGNPMGDSLFRDLWQAQRNAEEWEKVIGMMDSTRPVDTDPSFARFMQRTLKPII